MLGLVASVVLRCYDYIKYHLGRRHESDYSEQLYEVVAVANIEEVPLSSYTPKGQQSTGKRLTANPFDAPKK